jgi:predicted Zn-dependent protease
VNLDDGKEIKYFTDISKSIIYISTDYCDDLNDTLIHELGHALGYFGHPTESGNIMKDSNGVTSLTTSEKNHLKVVYDTFAN